MSSKKQKEKQIVQAEDPIPKTSPLQSIVSSVEESASSSKLNWEVKVVKVKTFRKITDGLLMANFQGDLGLQNVREAVLKRVIRLLRRENKLFRHVFKDLRVDCELRYFEN